MPGNFVMAIIPVRRGHRVSHDAVFRMKFANLPSADHAKIEALMRCERIPLLRVLWLTWASAVAACSGPAESGTQGAESGETWRAPHTPAFPGAEGYGSRSKGGRGGRIMQVVSLADSGPGTLRECIEAMGPRVCIFRVSGLIRFTGLPPRIRHPRPMSAAVLR